MSNPKPLNIVLAVVDPEYSEEVNVEEIVKDKKLFKSAARLAERNGLYYYFISRLRELNVDLPFLDVKRWEKENKRLKEFKGSVKLLNKVSSDYGVDYILIKECNVVPHVSRDVDIFVRNADRTKIIDGLKSYGMEYIETGVTETILRKEGYIDIELYSRICYLGMDFMGENLLWELTTNDVMFGIKHPSLNKEADFLLTLIHRLVGHRSMSLLDFVHMIKLMNEANIDTCRKYAHEKGWGSVFDLTLNRLDFLHDKIYKEGEIVHFPYLFDRNFMMKCISEIEKLDTKKLKIVFYLSLIQDEAVEIFKDSFLYNIVKSSKSIEKLITFFIRLINFKEKRGDTHR